MTDFPYKDLVVSVHPRFAEGWTVICGDNKGHYGATWSPDRSQLIVFDWYFETPIPGDAEIVAALTSVDWRAVRATRTPLLEYTDQVASRCFKAGVEWPADWKTYTQALRDITKQLDPLNVVWPVLPALPAGV